MQKVDDYILICDDDEGIADVTKIVLEDKGYQVESCSNGEDVLKMVAKKIPKLLLIDLWMPGMNGDEVTRQLKENPKTKNIPVIVISANKETDSISKSAGADGSISKPFEIKDLEDIAEKYMSN